MPDEWDDDDQEDQPQEQEQPYVQLPRGDLRSLRKKAKAHDEWQSRATAAERQLAFARARLDLEDPRIRYFIKGYEGDLTSDAIRAQAEADGFLQPVAPAETREELEAQDRIARASVGATPSDARGNDWVDRLAKTRSADEVMALAREFKLPTVWETQ